MPEKNLHSGNSLRTSKAVIDLAIFIVGIACLVGLRFYVSPSVSPATFLVPGQQPHVRSLPAFFPSDGASIGAEFTMELSPLHPRIFAVQVDDCIEKLTVNSVLVIPVSVPRICSPHDLTRVDLGQYLNAGTNTFSMSITDIGVTGGLSIQPSNTDPLLLAIWIGILLLIVSYTLRLRILSGIFCRFPTLLIGIALFGILIRFMYVSVTPYNVRTHDLDGHLEYASYVQQHWSVPPAAEGWEFHQPPLYYALAAGWLSFLDPFDFPETIRYQSLAGWSLVLSILTFIVTLYGLKLLFGVPERKSAAKAGMILAVFSGFVFFASRITNETLSALLTASTIVLLLLWWKRGDRRTLFALAFVFSLGFLTKVSILALVPAIALCLLLRPHGGIRKRIGNILIVSLIVLVSSGWYPLERLLLEPQTTKSLSFGNDEMNPDLAVPRDAKHLLVMNPIQIVAQPFNDPWNDSYRRGFFLEYFFRSAFFGEFKFLRFTLLAQSLLVLGLLLLPAILYGMVVDIRRRCIELLPLHLATGGMLVAAFLYPFFFAFASNQDFRFSVILILPAAYYAVRGIDALPRWLKLVSSAILTAFIVAATYFMIALFIAT